MHSASALAVLRLARVQNGLIAALGVAVGAWWAGGSVLAWSTLVTALASVALATFANAFNDVCDEPIDRVAHPERPLPSGALSSRAAIRVAWAGAIVGVMLIALVSPMMALGTAGVVALMREYSLRIKAHGLPGNLVVAGVASLPFVYGAWSAGNPLPGVTLAAVAAPLHLARELAKDLDDAEGDAVARQTLAVTSTTVAKQALLAAMLAFLAAIGFFSRSRPAAVVALFPATAVAAIAAWRAIRSRPGGPRLFKLAMVLAMLSLFTLDTTSIT